MKYFALALRRLVMLPVASVVTTSNLKVLRLFGEVVISGVGSGVGVFGEVVFSGVGFGVFGEVVIFGVEV
nr:hypothetical protein [Dolichospermum sp. LEGE 00240]